MDTDGRIFQSYAEEPEAQSTQKQVNKMFKTLAEIRDSNVASIAGVVASSDAFTAYVNEATERLLDRGDWWQTVAAVNLCVKRGCVVLPRYIASIREMKTCGGYTQVSNEWYQFQNPTSYYSNDYYNGYGNGFNGLWDWNWCQQNMVAKGVVPTHNTIMGAGRKVRAYAQTNADHGKSVTIFGLDNNQRPLQHRDPDTGVWMDGIVLRLLNPYAETEGYVSTIDRVLKDETQKPITLYAYNVADAVLEDLAYYEPSETNPAFRRYQFNAWPMKDEDGNEKYRPVCALVKLNFVPAKYPTDLVLISDIPALKLMVAAIKCEEGNDFSTAQANEFKAIQALNFQLRNMSPGAQTTVNLNISGGVVRSPI